MKKTLTLLLLATAWMLAAGEAKITELNLWKFQHLSGEITGNRLRLREIGPKNYGTAKTRIAVGKNKYMQPFLWSLYHTILRGQYSAARARSEPR